MAKQAISDNLGDKFCASILLWGAPGSGKTSFLGTYTKGPVHIYETDPQGTAVLRDTDKEITGDVFTDAIHGPGKTYPAFWKQLQKDEKDGFFKEMLEKEGIVVVDSYTTLENYMVEYVASQVLNKKQQSGGAYDIRREDWPTISSYVLAFLKHFARLPCATVLICHEKSVQDGDQNIFWRPTILGQQAESAPRWFVEYGHVTLSGGTQRIRVMGNPTVPASNRLFSGKKIRELINPSMDDFYKAFHRQPLDCKTA